MIPAKFDYVRPGSLDEAVRALADGGEDAKIIAGGQSLLPLLRLRLANPELLIGARTTHYQLIQAAQVHQQLRVGQPQAQQRKQALPARDDLRVVTAVSQGPDRLAERARTDVVELGRDHAAPPSMPCGLLPWVWSLCRAACCSAALD